MESEKTKTSDSSPPSDSHMFLDPREAWEEYEYRGILFPVRIAGGGNWG